MKVLVTFEPVEVDIPQNLAAIKPEAHRDEAINEWLADRFVDADDGGCLDTGWTIIADKPKQRTRK